MRSVGLKRAIVGATAALLLPVPAAAEVKDWIADNRARILRDYAELLAIPNVASDTLNIRRNAEYLRAMMAARGLNPRLLEHGDPKVPPAVYGEWLVPGAKRTLVLYAHYDGQPVNPADWQATKPFEPTLRTDRFDRGGKPIPLPKPGAAIDPEWRLYGRAASDDKAGVMAILSAVDALKADGKRPAYNVKIFLEGEEEAGSPHLAALLAKHKDLLASDGWVIFDGPAHQSGAPQVVLGVRGITGADIIVYGPARPLHSGHYGNWAPDPGMMLAQLLATMEDQEGRVRIAGFYDDVEPLTAAEQASIAAAPPVDAALKADLGLARSEGGGKPLVALIHEPSLTVTGLKSAEVGEAARNAVASSAAASVDLRLVKGNDHQRQFDKLVRHIRAQGFHVTPEEPTAEERRRYPRIARVVKRGGYNAQRTGLDLPLAQDIIAAVKAGADEPVVVLPTMGGSLPLYIFDEVLGADSITIGLANHDNNQHAEDENLRLGNLWRGIAVAAAVMQAE